MRVADHAVHDDPGLTGHWLPLRLTGAHVHLCSRTQYAQQGSVVRAMCSGLPKAWPPQEHGVPHDAVLRLQGLCEQLQAELRARGRKPMIVPVGASNALGIWGYLQCAQELAEQHKHQPFTDIVMVRLRPHLQSFLHVYVAEAHPAQSSTVCAWATSQPTHCLTGVILASYQQHLSSCMCDSPVRLAQPCSGSGTTVGLALGNHLSQMGWRLTAYGVSDTPEYFQSYMQVPAFCVCGAEDWTALSNSVRAGLC